MSIDALILGKLHDAAERRHNKAGDRSFVVATVRAAVNDGDGVFVNVIAFDAPACAALLGLDKGDAVALAGALKPGTWVDRNGMAHPRCDLVASKVLTPYALRRKRAAMAGAASASTSPRAEPPDDLEPGDEGTTGDTA